MVIFHSYVSLPEGILTVDLRQSLVNLDRWQIQGGDPIKSIENPMKSPFNPPCFSVSSSYFSQQITSPNPEIELVTGHFRNRLIGGTDSIYKAYIIFQALISGNIPRLHMARNMVRLRTSINWILFKSPIEVTWKITIFN